MATDAEWRYTEEGEKVRVSRRTGRIIPIPGAAEESYEYRTRQTYRGMYGTVSFTAVRLGSVMLSFVMPRNVRYFFVQFIYSKSGYGLDHRRSQENAFSYVAVQERRTGKRRLTREDACSESWKGFKRTRQEADYFGQFLEPKERG